MKVVLLGADGFLGRHILFHLQAMGHKVIAVARRPDRLANMGFDTFRADLTDPATHDPAFWHGHMQDAHLINAAGLLTGTAAAFHAVHLAAPKAALAALPPGHHALLISAVGIEADTDFAHWRRQTEALFHGHPILRPGMVLADTSYGGSSALRAFAAFPFLTPVVGDGQQVFNPVHAEDLAALALQHLTAAPGITEVGGPEILGLTDLTLLTRRWLGLEPQRVVHIPLPVARALGHLGDLLRLGPISATAVAQLTHGVQAKPGPVRGVTTALMRRPAGTQDLWHARLYLLKPMIRLMLAVLWLYSGTLGLLLAADTFANIPAPPVLARIGGGVDLALGLALLRDWRPRLTGWAQLGMVLGYTLGLSLIAPQLWADPFGGLLKNLPILALILTHMALIEER